MIVLNCSSFIQHDLKNLCWSYVLPVICLIGIGTNLLSSLVFSNKSLQKHDIYRYLKAHSTIQVIFLVLSLIYFVAYALYEGSFYLKLFDFMSQKYLTSVLALLMVCIEFLITIKRVLMIFNLSITIKISLRVTLLIYFILCLIVHLPVLIAIKIETVRSPNNCSHLTINANQSRQKIIYEIAFQSNNSKLFKSLLSIPIFIRGALLQIILLISNLIILIDYRKKRNLPSNCFDLYTYICISFLIFFL